MAGVTYAYSIEIGPSDKDKDILVNGMGFHIKNEYIKQIAKTAYDGLYAYMQTFIDPLSQKESNELMEFCSREYEHMKKGA